MIFEYKGRSLLQYIYFWQSSTLHLIILSHWTLFIQPNINMQTYGKVSRRTIHPKVLEILEGKSKTEFLAINFQKFQFRVVLFSTNFRKCCSICHWKFQEIQTGILLWMKHICDIYLYFWLSLYEYTLSFFYEYYFSHPDWIFPFFYFYYYSCNILNQRIWLCIALALWTAILWLHLLIPAATINCLHLVEYCFESVEK